MKKDIKKIIKLFITSIILCMFVGFSNLYAETEVMNLGGDEKSFYELVDSAFREKDADSVFKLLSANRLKPDYSVYEEYVLQKTKSLLLSNQLDLIQSMCMAIIDNNLDNTDAVNLYMTVEKSVAKRNARQKALEDQRKAEAEYVAQASTKEKESIRKDYNVVESSASGQTLFVAPVTSKYYSNFTWSVALNIAEIGFRYAKDFLSLNYGVGISGDFYYRAPKFSLGADFFVDTSVLNFTSADMAMSELSLIPGIAFTTLSEDFFFRTGFSQMTLSNGHSFLTPTIGFALKNMNMDNTRLSVFADYYLGHLFDANMKTAFGAGAQATFLFGNIGNVNLAFFLNLRESLFVLNDGIDNRTRLTIGLGVENNE